MKNRSSLLILLILALLLPVATKTVTAKSGAGDSAAPSRPEGPCDIYAADGCPCVAAHSTTRALYASYNGPLYQVMRQSDGKTLDIGVVQPSVGDAGGYADAAAQDAFCVNTACWITTIYDQAGNGNHLVQAPRGGFSGPAMGGFNNIPIADMAPITIMGHKAYGVFIEPGMGLRWNDAKGTAVDDQAEGQYWVINGHHYNSGCCFDYGNAETDSRDDGDGTMETTYYGNATAWYHGQAPGPWIMTDQENNLVGCVNPDPNEKYCPDLPIITWRFVTATADGEPHHWRSMGGDAQQGDLEIMFDGPRVLNDRNSYDPMRKQGAILLGNGGDNSNGSQGTFYEGAMTAPGTFPTEETNQKVQANVVAAGYDVQRLSLAPAHATATPPGLQTFVPQSSQNTSVTFTNTTGATVKNVTLSISVPKEWKSVVLSSKETSKMFADPIAPGASVSATFTVTSGPESFNGDLVGKASWTNSTNGQTLSETTFEKVRNVSPIKINEFRISAGSPDNSTDSFIELYNAGDDAIDISAWSLTHHPTQLPIFSSIKIPAGTKLAPRGFYLLGLSNSGLSVPAKKGESTIYVRSTTGMSVGDIVEIGTGSAVEIRKIASILTPPVASNAGDRGGFGGFGRRGETSGQTTVWQPIPDGPVITIPAGSVNIPVTSVAGFEVGQKMGIGYGAVYPTVAQAVEKYEVVTITQVGKPGTQAWLSADAKTGDTNIKVSSVENISVGDTIRLDIDSKGHGIETVTVTRVGTQSARSTFRGPLTETEDPGTGLDLAEPLKYDHASNMPFSVSGTGISFEPSTAFDHSSNEPVLALGTGITLDQPLATDHDIHAVVRDAKVTTAGYLGTPAPDQWFGGPALDSRAGNMVLRDAAGRVVDSQNYGGLVDPWAAEGYQAASGAGENGCSVPAPTAGRGRFGFFRPGSSAAGTPNLSAGRFPDGLDTDSNCTDFQVQSSSSLTTASAIGANNIKVAGVEGFVAGQKIVIDAGENLETAVIATVGTAGGTTVGAASEVGATVITVEDVTGFSDGQTITIDNAANRETAIVASVTRGRRAFGNFPGRDAAITVAEPLKFAHAEGALVSGSGVTLATPLTRAHESGAPIANGIPTPGTPNQYYSRRQ
ncbi:lamin tail domain-containing protein [candidate division KSB1 bacterium]|nr:lamin tail domain-containing protein [candidate division KSB1 bacterium]